MPKMASELISGFEFELSSYFVFAAELQKKPERKFDHLLLKFNISGPFFKFKVFLSSFFLTENSFVGWKEAAADAFRIHDETFEALKCV